MSEQQTPIAKINSYIAGQVTKALPDINWYDFALTHKELILANDQTLLFFINLYVNTLEVSIESLNDHNAPFPLVTLDQPQTLREALQQTDQLLAEDPKHGIVWPLPKTDPFWAEVIEEARKIPTSSKNNPTLVLNRMLTEEFENAINGLSLRTIESGHLKTVFTKKRAGEISFRTEKTSGKPHIDFYHALLFALVGRGTTTFNGNDFTAPFPGKKPRLFLPHSNHVKGFRASSRAMFIMPPKTMHVAWYKGINGNGVIKRVTTSAFLKQTPQHILQTTPGTERHHSL